MSREDLWFIFQVRDLIYSMAIGDGLPEQKAQRIADFGWPLVAAKARGIETGRQWIDLGWLAARYARRFTVSELANELWEVMQASPQSHGYGKDGPWRRSHAVDIAARARRFADRSDAAQAEFDHRIYVAALPWLNSLKLPPLTFEQIHRQVRRMGVRR